MSHNENEEVSDQLKALRDREEFRVPEGYFSHAGQSMLLSKILAEDEFRSPVAYFEESLQSIGDRLAFEDPGEKFFRAQEEAILHKALQSQKTGGEEELRIPSGFFEEQEKEILAQTVKKDREVKIVRFTKRFVIYAAAAAVLLISFFLFYPKLKREEEAFAEAMQKAAIDLDDIHYITDDELIYAIYLEEIPLDVLDTLDTDSLMIVPPDTGLPGEELDPKTGLPVKKNKDGIKPSSDDEHLTWDDISDEELMRYLMEKGDDDLFEEN